ncbi:MAG: Holliday junction branch migration protein RuvA [Flavobacteriaceae bacterium]|nr:Holliday junction branch migration protein RuvA [Flavobacteriaceae bacterium]
MYAFLRGKIVHAESTSVVLDCNGVGYELQTSLNTSSLLKVDSKQDVTLFVYLQVKEDSLTFYGFKTILEKEVFKLLVSVSGIGGNTARSILSSLSPTEIRHSIVNQDIYPIKSCKGIGLKTAQRLCIELKDKMISLPEGNVQEVQLHSNPLKDEVIKALEVLGYTKRSTEKIVDRLVRTNSELQTPDIVKLALNKL